MNNQEWLDLLLATDLFEIDPRDQNLAGFSICRLNLKHMEDFFIIIHTDFFVDIWPCWYEQQTVKAKYVSFEDIFELAPKDIQIKMLYHLDLLTQIDCGM